MYAELLKELTARIQGTAEIVFGTDYERIKVDGRTIAYVVARKRTEDLKIDFAKSRAIPRKFRTKALTENGTRATFIVSEANFEKGRELLEWLAA